MAEHYSFFDPVEVDGVYDREYNAQEFTDYFGALITTGVMKGAFNMLAVTANGSNMVTRVNTGIAFVEAKRYFNDAPLPFPHDTETIGLSRIDRIVVRMDQNVESRYVKAFVKKGAASTNPSPPTLTQNNTVYEISLAQIRIVGGQTYIASNAVTDERGTDIICPWAGSNILPSFDDNVLSEHKNDYVNHPAFITAQGTANAITAKIDDLSSYVDGMGIVVKIATQNTASTTININGLGAKSIRKANGSTLSSGNLKVGSLYTLRYNATTGFFYLQGEGGEYGTAEATQVLSGYTVGRESGIVNGLMPNRGSMIFTPSRVQQSIPSGYHSASVVNPIEFAPGTEELYYDGSNKAINVADTPTLIAKFKMNDTGVYRVKFAIYANTNAIPVYAQIYKNGTPYGTLYSNRSNSFVTFTEDLRFEKDDMLEIMTYVIIQGYSGLLNQITISYNPIKPSLTKII